MVELRHLGKQAQPLTGASERRANALAVADGDRRQIVDAVDLPGGQSNCLTEAGVLDAVPRVLDRGKACLDVTGGRVAEALERSGIGPRHAQVGLDVGSDEQVLQDVRTVLDPLLLSEQVLVRVDERELGDLVREVGRLLDGASHRPTAGPGCGVVDRFGRDMLPGLPTCSSTRARHPQATRKTRARVRPTRSSPAAGFEEPSRAGAARRRPM